MKLILRIVSASLLLCAVLLGIEVYFRIFSDCHLSGIAYDSTLGWRLKKNRSAGSNPGPVISFNARGFRDKNHHLTKDPQTARILVLGDSYTAGLEYSDSQIFTSLFEYKLNQALTGNVHYEIMNVSVPAWATDQQYLYLKNEGIRYKPDFVIVMIAPNDIRESYAKKFFTIQNQKLKEKGAPPIPLLDRLCWLLANRSCFFQHLQKRKNLQHGSFAGIFHLFPISFPVGSQMCNDTHLFLKKEPREIMSAMKLFETFLLQMNGLCKESGAQLILSIIPTKMEFDGTLNSPEYQPGKLAASLQQMAAKNKIPFLNLYSDLKSTEKDPLKVFLSSEYHLNEYGHRFVAERLLSFFVKNLWGTSLIPMKWMLGAGVDHAS